jgi:hypothetical protein
MIAKGIQTSATITKMLYRCRYALPLKWGSMSNNEAKPTRMWQEIAQDASTEKDSKKLNDLSDELGRALEERDEKLKAAAKQKSA